MNMGEFQVFEKSGSLKERDVFVIILYPKSLEHLVRPGDTLRLYHGSYIKGLSKLVPMNEFAKRNQLVSKISNQYLRPLLFFTNKYHYAVKYASRSERNCRARLNDKLINHKDAHGSVYHFEIQLPKQHCSNLIKFKKILCNKLDQVVVITNHSVVPIKEDSGTQQIMQELLHQAYHLMLDLHQKQNQKIHRINQQIRMFDKPTKKMNPKLRNFLRLRSRKKRL
jgi:hypothetical protein